MNRRSLISLIAVAASAMAAWGTAGPNSLAIAADVAAACASASNKTATALRQRAPRAELGRAALHEYHECIWNAKRLDTVDRYIAPDMTSHWSGKPLPMNADGSRKFLAMIFTAFPDLYSSQDLLLADGDKAVIRWTISGTHRGDFMGVAPTGKRIEVSGMDILRVNERGQFVEHWGGVGDQFPKILAQLRGDPEKK
jgi:predicted ester cyclase